jgi:hypothetical protein
MCWSRSYADARGGALTHYREKAGRSCETCRLPQMPGPYVILVGIKPIVATARARHAISMG